MRFARTAIHILALGVLWSDFTAFAQQAAQMSVERHKEIIAGDTIPFTVKVDKAPNLGGTFISVTFGPKETYPDSPSTGANASPVSPGSTLYKGEVTIPVTSRTGSWHVVQVALGLPAAPNKPLKFDDVQFDVKARDGLILPGSASVQIGK